ncbi:Aprataxin-like protein [Pseudolycoriella hygida]|uniref:Aprataxin-like protein n=1 Tax=Pseudolycoriella hygida TaxID=35572 RepID=A0A9Q0MXP7_9DIPT|nr:Aprataxin-like protein [Pseudolycoriella hygida]
MTKNKGSWSLALLETMKDPLYRVISSEIAVVIKDKFPKAKYHFLILPYEDIPTVFHLTSSERHLKLMDELELLAKNVVEVTGLNSNIFQVGYHSSPSMQRLHLHVISNDYNSPCLKTKIHWNSFNTKFFWDVKYVHKEIRRNGKVNKPNPDISKQLLATELRCHKCDFRPKNMPELKQHLLSHITC